MILLHQASTHITNPAAPKADRVMDGVPIASCKLLEIETLSKDWSWIIVLEARAPCPARRALVFLAPRASATQRAPRTAQPMAGCRRERARSESPRLAFVE